MSGLLWWLGAGTLAILLIVFMAPVEADNALDLLGKWIAQYIVALALIAAIAACVVMAVLA